MKSRLGWIVGAAVLAFAGAGVSGALAQGANATTGTAAPSAAPQRVAQAAKPYYIEFRARSAHNYGHTFAVIARNGQKLSKSNVHGLHPATESPVPWMIGHIIAVPSETGWSDGDIEDKYIIARYRVQLSTEDYRKLMAFVNKLKANSPHWHAVLYNCNAFVGDIASHMGLKTPASTLLMPKEYITELKNLNVGGGPRQAAVRSSAGQY